MLWESIAVTTVVTWLIYKWATATYRYFEIRKIPYIKPIPFLGSHAAILFQKKSIFDFSIDLYRQFSSKVFGIFEGRLPVLGIKDPELIREITVKDFDHFVNHRNVFSDDDKNSLFANSLFVMTDQKWRDMRATLSPAFTGSKMRLMYQLIHDVCTQSVLYLKNHNKEIEIDLKDYFTRFTNDVIATTAFGIKVDSLQDRENEFYRMGKEITSFGKWFKIKFLFIMFFKKLAQILKVEAFNKKYTNFFMNLVLDAMKYRADHGIFRPDMINMLMEATGRIKSEDPSKDPKPIREWNDTEIVAQCFLFFFAGFETVSALMCFAAHEIMENPDVQEKLLEEIQQVLESGNGKPVTYEALQNMKYLDAVIAETLRKWPLQPGVDRLCTKNFQIEDAANDIKFEVNVGDCIWISIAGLHRDERYFPNPLTFDPERFNEENKGKIQPSTYLPFGIGPRSCIASRFALLEAKAILFHLLKEFRFEASEKTTIPLKISNKTMLMVPENGFWLKFVPRN